MRDRKGNSFTVGDCVIYYDQDEETRDLSRIWAVDEIRDDSILISDDSVELIVYSNEIEKV